MKRISLLCLLAVSAGAHAGLAIHVTQSPPARVAPAPALAPALAPAALAAEAPSAQKASAAALPVATQAPAVVVVVAAPEPAQASITLKKGKQIEAQLREYARQYGWTLYWQAPEFVLDNDTVITGDFESALSSLLGGANEAGAQLQANFYRGNKAVRITGI